MARQALVLALLLALCVVFSEGRSHHSHHTSHHHSHRRVKGLEELVAKLRVCAEVFNAYSPDDEVDANRHNQLQLATGGAVEELGEAIDYENKHPSAHPLGGTEEALAELAAVVASLDKYCHPAPLAGGKQDLELDEEEEEGQEEEGPDAIYRDKDDPENPLASRLAGSLTQAVQSITQLMVEEQVLQQKGLSMPALGRQTNGNTKPERAVSGGGMVAVAHGLGLVDDGEEISTEDSP
eukprot:gnl/Hemi2/9508_TR3308_c0_g1_i2.p1 gnl/Hemi2/9508_TR3308_c0_g1~~gnl/Hemi2/9508_TR3308_c0_g1_i2.p1  ORF type:complete len:254 (+),score=92.53 gnl/Hemi2/9508_TR3308_c0_g1_i2:50-763(+)